MSDKKLAASKRHSLTVEYQHGSGACSRLRGISTNRRGNTMSKDGVEHRCHVCDRKTGQCVCASKRHSLTVEYQQACMTIDDRSAKIHKLKMDLVKLKEDLRQAKETKKACLKVFHGECQ